MPTRLFLRLNKNLMNYPLARDKHVRPKWNRSDKYQRRWCDLPGVSEVKLRLPLEARRADRRVPTAFDMNVLFLILLEAQLSEDGRSARFGTRSDILRRLRVSVTGTNRAKLDDALWLWSHLSIAHRSWYTPRDRQNPNRETKQPEELPPPLVQMRERADNLSLRVHGKWARLMKGSFFADVDLPLPMTAAEQNAVLMLLAFAKRKGIPHQRRPTYARHLCQKIGLEHTARLHVLRERVLPRVRRWFDRHGYTLLYQWVPGQHRIYSGVGKDSTWDH